MIRTSSHILKYSTTVKQETLDSIFNEYSTVINSYIQILWNLQDKTYGSFLNKEIVSSVDTWLSARLKQCAGKQALQIVKAIYKQNDDKVYKLYKKVYKYCLKKNKFPSLTSLRFKEFKKDRYFRKRISMPLFNGASIELSNNFFNLSEDINSFDLWIKFKSFTSSTKRDNKFRLSLPTKKHLHFNKLRNKKFTLKQSCRLRKYNNNYYLDLFHEKKTPLPKDKGTSLGIDIGYKKLIVTSNNEVLGKELEQVYNRIANKQQGSKNFKQLLTYRDHQINEIINNLDLSNIKELKIEDLKNVKHKSKFSRKFNNKLQRWVYSKVISKLERLCEENSVLLTKVNPAYTSQTCSNCGTKDKKARKGETYSCKVCGLVIDADYNASINILHREAYSLSTS